MIIYLSPLVALIGAGLFAFAANSKLQELGKIMFACGLLAFLLAIGTGHAISIPPKG